MNNENIAVTEAEIFSHAIDTIDRENWRQIAKTVSKLALPETDLDRVDQLLEKNRSGLITTAESGVLEKYLRVGNFLALMRARAARELGHAAKA